MARIGVAAALTGERSRTRIAAIDRVHEANIVERELIALPDRSLIVAYVRFKREKIVVARERFAPARNLFVLFCLSLQLADNA